MLQYIVHALSQWLITVHVGLGRWHIHGSIPGLAELQGAQSNRASALERLYAWLMPLLSTSTDYALYTAVTLLTTITTNSNKNNNNTNHLTAISTLESVSLNSMTGFLLTAYA